MTTTISKILAVFVTIASVAFMAVVIANVSAGGPNWVAKSKELDDVAFERANPQAPWTAKGRSDGADLGGGPILPAAIVSAQKKLIDAEKAKHTTLDDAIAKRKSIIAEAKALIEADTDAMKRREADLDKQFADLLEQMNQVSQNFTMESKKQTEDLAVLKLRAQEYILIKNQLEELRAQREVASEDLARLKALVYQAKANLERAQKRRELLEKDGAIVDVGSPNDPPKSAPGSKPAPKAQPADGENPAAEKPDEADKPEAKPEDQKEKTDEKPESEPEKSDSATDEKKPE